MRHTFSNTTPALPIEVFEHIIDLAHEFDPKSVYACARVHTTWLPRSRYNIFAWIEFLPDRWTDNVAELFTQDAEASGDRRWECFIALLEAAPHIRPLVHTLSIESECPAEFLLHGRLAVLLPSVHTVVLYKVAVQPSLIMALPDLEALIIRNCRSLSLGGARVMPRSSLRNLLVHHCGSAASSSIYAQLSLMSPIASNLSSATLELHPGHGQLITALLANQSSLSHLQLVVLTNAPSADVELSLGQLGTVKSLTIICTFAWIQPVLKMLKTAILPALRKLRINLMPEGEEIVPLFDPLSNDSNRSWSIGQALYTSLEDICIEVHGAYQIHDLDRFAFLFGPGASCRSLRVILTVWDDKSSEGLPDDPRRQQNCRVVLDRQYLHDTGAKTA